MNTRTIATMTFNSSSGRTSTPRFRETGFKAAKGRIHPPTNQEFPDKKVCRLLDRARKRNAFRRPGGFLDCGGKRSATPLWVLDLPAPSKAVTRLRLATAVQTVQGRCGRSRKLQGWLEGRFE